MRAAPHQHSTHPLAFLAITLIAGILCGQHLRLPVLYLFFLTVVLLVGLVWFCRGGTPWPPDDLRSRNFVTKHPLHLMGRPRSAAPTVMALISFVAGMSLMSVRESRSSASELVSLIEDKRESAFDLVGTVDGPFELSRTGAYFQIRIKAIIRNGSSLPVDGMLSLFKPFRRESERQELIALNLCHRDLIRFSALLNREDKFRNPGGTK